MDTFQLIAFILSGFNVASIMAANANNNNNNNNINDNANDINDNNINESNTNAEVMSMVMVGLGGRGLSKRSSGTMNANDQIMKGNNYMTIRHTITKGTNFVEKLHETVADLLQLVMRSHVTPSVTCLEKLFCDSGKTAGSRGGFSMVLSEMTTLLLAKNLPSIKPSYRSRILQAGKYGRSGLNCTAIFDKCEAENWNFINIADAFTWSPVADLKAIEKLVSWAYNK